MKHHGFIRVMSKVPEIKIGDVDFNVSNIITAMGRASQEGVDILSFPELCVTGYTCGDLFNQKLLIEKAEEGVSRIIEASTKLNIFVVVGAPVCYHGLLYNCGLVISGGKLRGIVPKQHLPNYNEFYEKRWFHSGKDVSNLNFKYAGQEVALSSDIYFYYEDVRIGLEICEDLWVPSPPSDQLVMAGCEVIINLSASDNLVGKHEYVMNLVKIQSARDLCCYIYTSAGRGESSSDLVFSGASIIGVNGRIFEHSHELIKDIDIESLRLDRMKFNTFFDNKKENRFTVIDCNDSFEKKENKILNRELEIKPFVDNLPFVPSTSSTLAERCREIINIQTEGLMTRLRSIGCRNAVIGISGGLDSTLALLVTVNAFDSLKLDRKGIIGITMPGLATSSRTKSNAIELMKLLGVSVLNIPISDAIKVHFKDIGQDPTKFDVTYENSQARERTQILMDIANKENAIVIGTGDMSELALGWCTYNGDQMSMYGVNAGVPKTLVKHLVTWFANEATPDLKKVLKDIIDTPISPELVPSSEDEIAQKTEDIVGPYELHDFFLYNFLRNSFSPSKILWLANIAFKDIYDEPTIKKWLKVFFKRFFSQQFKRNPMPDGPKVGSVSLSPRGDWRMPSDASSRMWLEDIQ